MSPWILLPITALVLYALWILLDFTFEMIDRRHDLLRQSERRNNGA